MCWHPRTIEWCLELHRKSPGAFNTMCLYLPSKRTLQGYRRKSGLETGLTEPIRQRAQAINLGLGNEFRGMLAWDGTSVKQNLVFQPGTNRLIGLVDYGNLYSTKTNDCSSKGDWWSSNVSKFNFPAG
eukprot:TRINITY_DN15790_c0_g1::TRINITY_DN15790_c0_g1_i1::g.25542::m.25542 TRINITY_DN15790_c0_g1::TRINITY_DN15790_c0_g1_i1::g.25542  ORF type:complete len:128 (-),score=4.27 TRINITY_DN15790_c0_g1_i1:254-637(-)